MLFSAPVEIIYRSSCIVGPSLASSVDFKGLKQEVTIDCSTSNSSSAAEHVSTHTATSEALSETSVDAKPNTVLFPYQQSDHDNENICLPYIVQHKLLNNAQQILECSCFEYAKKVIPHLLKEKSLDCPEAAQVNDWFHAIKLVDEAKLKENAQMAKKDMCTRPLDLTRILWSIKELRNKVVHREVIPAIRVTELLNYAMDGALILQDRDGFVRLEKLRDDSGRLHNELVSVNNESQELYKTELLLIEKKRADLTREAEEAKIAFEEHRMMKRRNMACSYNIEQGVNTTTIKETDITSDCGLETASKEILDVSSTNDVSASTLDLYTRVKLCRNMVLEDVSLVDISVAPENPLAECVIPGTCTIYQNNPEESILSELTNHRILAAEGDLTDLIVKAEIWRDVIS